MRLPPFEYLKPETVDQAVDMLADYREDARILAGGTDLLVRMKKGLLAPLYLISLKDLDSLSYIKEDSDSIKIGAKTPLIDIIRSESLKTSAAALVQACEKVGAVSLQHYKGTIGGNILQNNRCHHYNQSEFYRSTRQPCHKEGGKICYAREEADRCNSTCQSDGAAALMALDAVLVLASKKGSREIKLDSFYTNDGITPFAIEPDELLTEIIVPVKGAKSAYRRLAYRSAIDYPIVCAGALLHADSSGKIETARIVVGAMGRAPLLLVKSASLLIGKDISDTDAFKKAADSAMDSAAAFAVHNVGATVEYRSAMVSQMVFQALSSVI